MSRSGISAVAELLEMISYDGVAQFIVQHVYKKSTTDPQQIETSTISPIEVFKTSNKLQCWFQST